MPVLPSDVQSYMGSGHFIEFVHTVQLYIAQLVCALLEPPSSGRKGTQ